MDFAEIAIFAMLSSNIVAMMGFGAVSLQTEKKNFFYMIAVTMCSIVAIICSGIIYCLIYEFVLIPLSATDLKLLVIVLLSLISTFLVRMLLKKISKEYYWLYVRGYSFAIENVICIGTLLLVDFTSGVWAAMFELGVFSIGFLLVQILFFSIYAKIDNKSNLKPARNVPLMLYTLSILSMIIYVIATALVV